MLLRFNFGWEKPTGPRCVNKYGLSDSHCCWSSSYGCSFGHPPISSDTNAEFCKVVSCSNSPIVELGVDWRNPILLSSGNLQNAPTSWKRGHSFGCERLILSARGLSRVKKCGVVVAAVGQQQLAARDRVVDFGKFKGTMMGTLSSRYLKWMVDNLKAGPFSEWSDYAEEVLADPYYRDRLEWEKVEQLMISAHDVASITVNRDEVFAPARMYGWDLQDDVGWRKVNFSFIGTTKGGRIPRVEDGAIVVVPELKKLAPEKKKNPIFVRTAVTTRSRLSTSSTSSDVDGSRSSGSSREEMMRRRAQRRHRLMVSRGLLGRE